MKFEYKPEKLVGYGPVNNWWKVNPWKLAFYLWWYKLNCSHIEMLGWDKWGSWFGGDMDELKKKYNGYLRAMRFFKRTTLVSILNDNKGSGKYEDDGQGAYRFIDDLYDALDIVLGGKKEGVIVQTVGETQTSAGSQFESQAISALASAGFLTCWNHGSRPRDNGPCSMAATHQGSMSSFGPPLMIDVTDHGNLLKWLNKGNDVYGMGNPDMLKQRVSDIRQMGKRGFIYYGFGHTEIDKTSIKAIGSAWHE